LNTNYIKTSINGQVAYVRIAILEKVKKVGAIIFDCDGVLIDVRRSYNHTIVKTIEYFLNTLMGLHLPSEDILNKTIYLYKRSGGFNNDWDIVYSILLTISPLLPTVFQKKFIQLVTSKEFTSRTIHDRYQYTQTILEDLKPFTLSLKWQTIINHLNAYAEKSDSQGITSVEQEFFRTPESENTRIGVAMKRFLQYPGNVKQSLVSRVFDEIFYGPLLFQKQHNISSNYYDGTGFVELERPIITVPTLTELSQIIGDKNFGIVSGRDFLSAKHTLGQIIDEYKKDALFFLQDYPIDTFEKLKKPSPLLLFKSAHYLNPFKYALYVGDSIEDILMVEKANEIDPRFISMGVYSTSDFKEEFILHLLEIKTDIILPSVNDISLLLSMIKEGNK
jgi:phosphoglycolate phosphatase-like HAD superfamily hydrolase